MNKGMLQRLRRGLVWLLTVLLVLGVLAGCAGNTGGTGTGTSAPAKQSSQAVPETTAGRPPTEAGSEAESGGQLQEEAGGEEEPGSQLPTEAGSEEEPGDQLPTTAGDETRQNPDTASLKESGSYTSKDQVALYLHTYGRLPDNYITKKGSGEPGLGQQEGQSLGGGAGHEHWRKLFRQLRGKAAGEKRAQVL